MICCTSFPLCRESVNSCTRFRTRFIALGDGHRCTEYRRGFRCMLRFFPIVQPKNTKLPFPPLKSTIRVFSGCSFNPSRLITSPIRRSASLACDSVRHIATKSSAYRTSTPSDERLSCSALFSGNVPPSTTPERSSRRSGPDGCLLPSPRSDRLGPFKHLSAENMTWLPRSLNVASRFLAPALSQPLHAPLWPQGSLLPAGVCYRARRRLPGRISHPLEERVFQDAPYSYFRGAHQYN
jgi:hypothetical protein